MGIKMVETAKRLLFLIVVFSGTIHAENLLDPTKLTRTLLTPKETKDQYAEQLAHLKDELAKLQDTAAQEKQKALQENLNQIDKAIAQTKTDLKEATGSEQEFLNKKMSILNEQYQTLFNIQFTIKEIITTLEQHIKILQEYQKDPGYKGFVLEPRSVYSYDDVQQELKKVFNQEEKLKALSVLKKDETVELQNREKKLAAATKAFQDKKKEQEEFAAKVDSTAVNNGELSFKQRGELLDLEGQVALYKKQLAEYRVQATTRKIASINTNIALENEKLSVLRQNLARAKAGLRIAENEVTEMKEKLEKKKQQSLQAKESLYEEIKKLSATKDKLKKELEALRKKHKIQLDKEDISSWPTAASPEQYTAICETGDKQTQIQLLDKKIEYLRAQIQLEDIKFRREEIRLMVLTMWYNLTHRKLVDSDDISQELKQFREIESEINREISSFQDKRSAVTNALEFQNKELGSIRSFIHTLQEDREKISKRLSITYGSCLAKLADAEKNINDQIEISNKLLEVYADAISTLQTALKEDSIIITELETKSIWQRSQYAISWNGVKNILPDIRKFIADIRQLGATYIASFSWSNVLGKLRDMIQMPGRLLFFIVFILFSIALIGFVKTKFLTVIAWFYNVHTMNSTVQALLRAIGCFLDFLRRYFVWIYLWFVAWGAIYFNIISDLFPSILFYLISIPYLMFITQKLISFFVICNRQQEFAIFHALFERRFFLVFSIFAYLSIFIWFFREAFVLATVHKSELPNILFAVYSIVLRVLIIFSIGKDEILSMIGTRGGFWQWIAGIIDRYYYVLLISIIGIMILSDPYVGGYGNLVSYILWGLVGTLILIRVLYIVHNYLKKYSEIIFFSKDDEVRKERFPHAKTCYGVFVISLFLFFIGVAIAVGFKIWDIPFTFDELWKFLDFHLFSTGTEKGEHIWFTPRKFLVLISFIVGGFLVALAVNRFVLQRIFDILPVDLGVQNTVFSITRYLIVVIAIYFGFLWAGLSNLLIAISVVIGTLSYILKEPVGDFISYFIILVQRPVQIGDFIQLTEDVQGVVRKITPRSVILRKKDSYSIILPNSSILTQPVSNWSYARNFVAFDDIFFTVSYSVDPALVRRLISKVLEENTEVLKAPKPIIRLDDFTENGYLFMVRAFISNINILRRWDIASDIRFGIVKALSEEQIKLAIPTRVIVSQAPYKPQHDIFTQQ